MVALRNGIGFAFIQLDGHGSSVDNGGKGIGQTVQIICRLR